jgi:predicted nucleotide-binding protein
MRLVSAAGYSGKWMEIANGHQFRSTDKAILNWYPMTAVVQYGGPSEACAKFEGKLAEVTAGTASDSGAWNAAAAPETASQYRIFIAHGHDDRTREQLELILHTLGVGRFVIANTAESSLTILEAVERETADDRRRCSVGIVLMTSDDNGDAERDGAKAIQPRPCPDVILEMGMLLAAVGRSRVIVLRKGDVEIPSAASGIACIPFNHHVRETVPRLVVCLRDAGFKIDADTIAPA